MKPLPLSKRLFRSIFAVSLITIALGFVAAEWIYEDIEESILYIEFKAEREYFRQRITDTRLQEWRTAQLHAIFLGTGAAPDSLPPLVRDLPVPSAREINTERGDYLVSIETIHEPEGTFYLIQDISTLESREHLTQLALLGVALVILLVTFVLSQLMARRLIAPINHLTQEILRTSPGKVIPRLSVDYREMEYQEIAWAFNRFLEELERFVQRENAFVNLASHELRTPLAIISGALDVIEKRGHLGESDQKTLARMRRASDEMQADVDILLKLARGRAEPDTLVELNLARALELLVEDLGRENLSWRKRLRLDLRDRANYVIADPALARILLRNLIQNALKHSNGIVSITLDRSSIEVSDRGEGLPPHVLEQINSGNLSSTGAQRARSGFGLLIIQLVCDRLGWRVIPRRGQAGGTVMEVRVGAAATAASRCDPVT